MATEITARTRPSASGAPDDGDYEAFCAALSASARGRAFLSEYSRRNRNADTTQLLSAIAQLQQTVTANSVPKVTNTIKAELRVLLDEISTAQSELEASIVATQATRLTALVALVARRITAIMELTQTEGPSPVSEASAPPKIKDTKELKDETKDSAERTHLAVVPVPEQPELPIPSPLITPLPPIALVRSETVMAEVEFAGPLPVPAVKSAGPTVDAPKIEVAKSLPASPVSDAKPVKPAGPLASIMALSEDERLALFT